MEPFWASFLCDIETSPVTAAHNGVQPSSSSPVGKHLFAPHGSAIPTQGWERPDVYMGKDDTQVFKEYVTHTHTPPDSSRSMKYAVTVGN